MKFNKILAFAAAFTALAACSSNQIIEDFESGLEKWTIEGDSFEISNASEELSGFEGFSYLRSSSDDSKVGSAVSQPFQIKSDYINLLVAGPKSSMGRSALSVSLVVDGEDVLASGSIGKDEKTFEWLSFDAAMYKGKTAQIKLTAGEPMRFGTRTFPRGFIAVDQIQQGKQRLSSFYPEYKVSVKVDKKYILIPAANNGSNSRLSVMVDDQNILGIAQSAKPATDRIDYYIPVNVEKYSGKTVDVILTNIYEEDMVFGAIKTSDEMMNEYNEQYRPLVHYSPEFGWTNDPNGMVFTPQGEWHLSLQYNPYGTSHGNMHWGLATSKDLIHWTDTPAIIAPDELGSIFSGSAVVDHDNTAGFGKDAIVAIYTSAGQGQRQSIAYSTDGGYTFTKYDKNPVLADPEQRDFRDPKVNRIGDQWVMALAVGQVVRFYGSPDLKNWSLLSDFGTGMGSHAGVWECPDLMCFDYNGQKKWVLFVSINPGGPNGGSITQYFIGDFDGKRFKADPLPYPLWVDEGVDNYAGVTFNNTTGRTVFMGWMSNWSYTGQTPTLAFRNSMTLPRDLSLKSNGKHLILSSVPSPEVYAARAAERAIEGVSSSQSFSIPSILENNKGAYEIDATITPDAKGEFTLTLSNSKGENAVFCFDTKSQKLSLDRSKSGNVDFSASFAQKPVVVSLNPRNEYKIQMFVDRLSTELFINDGDMVFTNCVFPSEVFNKFDIASSNCKISVKDVKVYELK
ncbi:MAG: GH32 C-terminal domain-containing protein [Bacteroidales bacterium]|nr:GH32 C-terminal domain-containing protein [Bacteroidales bacterium]